MPYFDYDKIDWGTVNTIRGGDASGPASGITTSSSTNENDLSVYGMNSFAADGMEAGTDKPWRKSGIHGAIHGDMTSQYSGSDGGAIVPQAAGMEGTPSGSPVAWWFAFIALLVAVKIISEKNGEEAEFKTIRVGAGNILIITISAIIGLTTLKWIFGVYKIPGLSQIVEAS